MQIPSTGDLSMEFDYSHCEFLSLVVVTAEADATWQIEPHIQGADNGGAQSVSKKDAQVAGIVKNDL